MTDSVRLFVSYLAIINFTALFMYGYDKYKAIVRKRRTSERFLLLLCLIGGSLGSLISMMIFRHKTLHKKFRIGVPIIFLVHCIVLFVIYKTRIMV